MNRLGLVVALPLLAGASVASASITVSQGNSAPQYAALISFDEVGGPTGPNVPSTSWATRGISMLVTGEGSNFVGDNSGTTGVGTNSMYAPFGVFMTLAQDVTALSMQFWDTSGPASPFGGGAGVFIFNDGVEVGSWFGTPALGSSTNSWFSVIATDGMVFDEVRALGFGFPADSFVDNISFVPAPGAVALLGFGGACALRRRRR